MKTRKILTIVLTAAMIFSLASVSAFAQETASVINEGDATFTGDNVVFDGTNYYTSLSDALKGIHGTDNAVLYCKPGANVGAMTHGHVCKNLKVYGNGATVSGDFEVNFPIAGGNSCAGAVGEYTLEVSKLNGFHVWGIADDAYISNIILSDCVECGIFVSGENSGLVNITMTNCSLSNNSLINGCGVFSNAAGTINLKNVDFSGISQTVDLSNKTTANQNITLTDCDFTNCGANTGDYTVPVRIRSTKEGGTSSVAIDNCTFTGTVTNSIGQDADILLDYGVGTTTATISGTAAKVGVEKEANTATYTTVTASETITATNAEIPATPVAKIGDEEYTDLQAAIDAAQNGDTITLLDNVVITEAAYGQNALNYAKAVDCTIDLNSYTLSADTGNSVFRFNISEANATSDVTVTLKNGKVISGANTWCAVMACGASADIKAIFNLENLIIENSKGYDFGVKAWENSIINAKNVTINATNQAGGFYAVGGEIILNDCTVNQTGLYTAPYASMAFAVASNGKLTINSGSYTTTPSAAEEGNGQGSTHGSWCGGVMNSGGSLIINGGSFANGNYGDDDLAIAARGLLVVDTGAYLEINGGIFKALKSIIDICNNLGDASKNPTGTITGGTFSADPTNNYVTITKGYEVSANEDGTYGVAETAIPVAKIGDVEYTDLQTAIDAAKNEDTIVLLADMTFESDIADAGKGYFNIPDGKVIDIDLNEKTINVTENSTGNFILFYNYGELTIKNGTINLTAIQNRGWNAESAIVLNRGGLLNVESGTFTHLGGTDMAFVVDNSGNWFGEATANIVGGTLTSSYIAIRNRMEQNERGYSGTAYLNIAGGTINGNSRAVWAQAASVSEKSPATGVINVTGGSVGMIDTARSSGAVCVTTLSGGVVDAFKVEKGELKITGGTVTGTLTILDASGNTVESDEIISGGTFSSDVSAYLADGYTLTANSDGTYSVESITIKTLPTINLLIQNMPTGTMTDANGETITTYRAGCFAAIDSTAYSVLGIEVRADGGKVTGKPTTEYLYTYITVTNNGVDTLFYPKDFGETNKYIFGRIIETPTNYTDFCFRPFAVSLDGKTTFYGEWSKEYTVDPQE